MVRGRRIVVVVGVGVVGRVDREGLYSCVLVVPTGHDDATAWVAVWSSLSAWSRAFGHSCIHWLTLSSLRPPAHDVMCIMCAALFCPTYNRPSCSLGGVMASDRTGAVRVNATLDARLSTTMQHLLPHVSALLMGPTPERVYFDDLD